MLIVSVGIRAVFSSRFIFNWLLFTVTVMCVNSLDDLLWKTKHRLYLFYSVLTFNIQKG